MSSGGLSGAGRTCSALYEDDILFWQNFFQFYYYDVLDEVDEKDDKPDKPQKVVKPPKEIDPDTLKVVTVDFNIKENTGNHNTDKYDIADKDAYDSRENLVVRRGQDFTFKIKFDRKYDEKKDDLRLIFEFGKKPSTPKGSYVEFILSAKDVPKEWGAYVTKSATEEWLTIVVTTPPTCAVGKWKMKIDVVKKKDKKSAVFRYVHKEPIYILFNPWSKDDAVFMEKEEELDEYILNDTVKLYRGSSYSISPKIWNLGQFSGNVLDCALYLLDDRSSLRCSGRGDPVKIARALSSLVNSCDNNGVLGGNWSGDYEGGESPLSWSGSVAIIEQFYKTKRTVNYGQCWVFSGVMTSLLRALGIPARSVTNFSSAHDTDVSMTIDVVYDKDGNKLDQYSDSIWNYHVWNECWMARPDLPKGYGGWQAVDATPQEASDGSPEEAAAVRKASQHSTRQDVYETQGEDMEFEIKFDHKNTFIGHPFELHLNMKNTSGSVRTVDGTLAISTIYQTGITRKTVLKECIDRMQLKGNESKTIKVAVPVERYLSVLTDSCMFGVSCMAFVKETQQSFASLDDMRLRKPHLTIEAPKTAKVGEKFQVKVSFKNPLPVPLSKCKLIIEGPGNQVPKTINQSDVGEGRMFEYVFELKPIKAGKKDVIVVFNSTELEGVDCLHQMTVSK